MIRHQFKLFLPSVLFYISAAHSTTISNNSDPNTFLGPTFRLAFTSNIGNESAYSLAGEAGPRNARVSGTLGWKIDDNQRFKVTAEYLWQQIKYGFFPADAEYWGQQGTVGVEYQYDIANAMFYPQLGFNAYASEAPSKNFGNQQGTVLNNRGIPVEFTANRRATGGRGYGAAPVITLTPWRGGKIYGEVNYDNVGYDNDVPVNQNARGFGGTAGVHQLVGVVDIGVGAAIRQPFNSYAANITWADIPYMRNWTLELFGEYTVGKHTLPDTYNVGICADFYFDRRVQLAEGNLKQEVSGTKPVVDNLMAWTAGPAVYMPVVLSVADEQVTLS